MTPSDVRHAYEAHGRNQSKTATALGKSRAWVQDQLAKTPDQPPPSENPLASVVENLRDELAQCRRSLADAVRPKFTIRQDNASKSGKIKVLVIGDAHDSPHIPDKSRFEWIGAHINASKPDVVVQIGDFASIDSLNQHEGNHTVKGQNKPSFSQDMESFNLALDALSSKLNFQPEMHCTLGNHERRIWAFEDEHPEISSDWQFRLFEILERHKWSASPYGMITYYGGCGYVHAAINSLGKTFGGKNAETTIANESIHDLTVGHSHRERFWRAPKIGGNNFIHIDNVGCSLPDGFIEPYAKHAMNGWSYGIAEQTIRAGHIDDRRWLSMKWLEESYGPCS